LRLQNGGKLAKAEAARAKIERDRKIAEDLKAKLDESEVTILTAAINTRIETAEAMFALVADFETAANHIHEVDDPTAAEYQKGLEDLGQIVIE
jgi:hypothetical protein